MIFLHDAPATGWTGLFIYYAASSSNDKVSCDNVVQDPVDLGQKASTSWDDRMVFLELYA